MDSEDFHTLDRAAFLAKMKAQTANIEAHTRKTNAEAEQIELNNKTYKKED